MTLYLMNLFQQIGMKKKTVIVKIKEKDRK